MDFLALPSILGVLIFVCGAILLMLVPYFALRAVFAERLGEDTNEIAGTVLFRIGALHSLILALVFADELVRHQDLRDNIAREAAAIGDVLRNLENYDPQDTVQISENVQAYLGSVVFEEWPGLAEQKLSNQTWLQWELMYLSILDLVPASPRDDALRKRLIQDATVIAEAREKRLFSSAAGVTPAFWVIAFVGFFFVSLPFFVFKPIFVNIFLLTVFGAYNGMIIYFILALGSPFDGPAPLEPTPFLLLHHAAAGPS